MGNKQETMLQTGGGQNGRRMITEDGDMYLSNERIPEYSAIARFSSPQIPYPFSFEDKSHSSIIVILQPLLGLRS